MVIEDRVPSEMCLDLSSGCIYPGIFQLCGVVALASSLAGAGVVAYLREALEGAGRLVVA